MKTKPILFSGPMVRALLDGSKTQTRRVLKTDFMHDPKGSLDAKWYFRGARAACWCSYETLAELVAQHCPYGQSGDRLWVRETFIDASSSLHSCVLYRADGDEQAGTEPWRPSIHMPRWASRITLEITGVRVERMQDISVADALAEGVNVHPDHHNRPRTSRYSPVQACRDLWEQINGPSSWDANPWVWVVEFKRVEGFAA